MNHLRKASAMKEFMKLKLEGKSIEEITDAINESEKQYTNEEAAELVESISSMTATEWIKQNEAEPPVPPAPANNLDKGTTDGPADHPHNVAKEKESLNKIFEVWRVTPKKNDAGNISSYEKDSNKPLRITSITPERAKELNMQTANSNLFYVEQGKEWPSGLGV